MKCNNKLTLYVLLLCHLFLPLLVSANNVSFNEKISRQFKRQMRKPCYLKCLPKSLINDFELERDFKQALMKKYSDIEDEDILKVIFQQKKWRISRNEFTAFISYRYMFAYILMKSRNSNEFLLVSCVFIQSNRFLGFVFGDTYYKNILSVDNIKKEYINKICR